MTSNLARAPRGLLIVTAIAALAAALAACSTSSGTGGTSGTGHTHTTAPKAKAASAPKANAGKATGALSGTWSGNYSGAYNGTFKLNWHQSGTHLHGTIAISNPGNTLPINGTVNGTAISFGTVGSTAITYTGTVSGNSMSGTYKVAAGNGSTGGPWSASKS